MKKIIAFDEGWIWYAKKMVGLVGGRARKQYQESKLFKRHPN